MKSTTPIARAPGCPSSGGINRSHAASIVAYSVSSKKTGMAGGSIEGERGGRTSFNIPDLLRPP